MAKLLGGTYDGFGWTDDAVGPPGKAIRLINFPTNLATLDSAHRNWLNREIVPLAMSGPFELIIAGMTSRSGPGSFNRQLSRARAEAVRDYLWTKLGPSVSMSLETWAADKSIGAKTDDAVDRAVLVCLVPRGGPRPALPIDRDLNLDPGPPLFVPGLDSGWEFCNSEGTEVTVGEIVEVGAQGGSLFIRRAGLPASVERLKYASVGIGLGVGWPPPGVSFSAWTSSLPSRGTRIVGPFGLMSLADFEGPIALTQVGIGFVYGGGGVLVVFGNNWGAGPKAWGLLGGMLFSTPSVTGMLYGGYCKPV